MWRNITIFLFLIVSCAFSSCKLDVDDDEKLPGDKFWNPGSPANVEAYMLSIYQCFRTATTSNGFFLYSGDLRCAPITNISTSNKFYGLLQNDMKLYKSKMDPKEEGKSSEFGAIYNWKNMYRVVQSANILLEEIDNVSALTEEEVAGYKAESIYLRSLAYFFMVRIFGDVPYYTEAYAASPLPRTPMLTVLKNCITDLQSLLDNDPNESALPWKKKNAKLRANRGAVLILMMHINMWLACFDDANAAVYYSEVKRLAEFDDIWLREGGAYSLQPIEQIATVFQGNTEESIFEIAQSITNGEVFDTNNMWTSNVVYKSLAKTEPIMVYSKEFLKELYPKEEQDRRKELWFTNLQYDNVGNIKSSEAEIEIIKMLNVDEYKSTVIPNSGNYIVFRLADAVLLYAEALEKLGEQSKALEQLNRIRSRAEATLVSTTDNLDAAIYWERVRELMGEGQYFYDLVRTGKLCEPDYSTFSDGSGCRIRRADFLQGAWTWPIYKGALENNAYISKNLYWE